MTAKKRTTTDFIGSFSFDMRLAPFDIRASLAHAAMLSKKNIIPKKAAQKITAALQSILADLKKGWALPSDEDVHFALEKEIIKRAGEAGKMLHTARSRNDQVITDVFLYTRESAGLILKGIIQLQKALMAKAEEHKTAVMPGYTHLQHAQPVLFSHHMLAYAWMLERDKGRMRDALKRIDTLPLGSAALAGTSFPIDQKMVARALGFSGLAENSIDATSSRDGLIEIAAANAILMSHLSRLSEELILWSSEEFGFVRISEEFTSGSSIMPQKRNPDVAEIIRGETGRVYGALVALLTIMKGLPLAYNRDLQEDKPPLFDSMDTVIGCLTVMAPMIGSLQVNVKILKNWCDKGYLAATELADFLARKGVPFRAAHGIVRTVVRHCQEKNIQLHQLTKKELRGFHPKFTGDALAVLSADQVVSAKTSHGGTSVTSVNRQLRKLKAIIK